MAISMIFTSCKQRQAKWFGKIEEVDGAIVVGNPKEPMYGEYVFGLEDELTIGEKQGAEENMFSQIIDVGVDDEENIYILDFKESHRKVFNKIGLVVHKTKWE